MNEDMWSKEIRRVCCIRGMAADYVRDVLMAWIANAKLRLVWGVPLAIPSFFVSAGLCFVIGWALARFGMSFAGTVAVVVFLVMLGVAGLGRNFKRRDHRGYPVRASLRRVGANARFTYSALFFASLGAFGLLVGNLMMEDAFFWLGGSAIVYLIAGAASLLVDWHMPVRYQSYSSVDWRVPFVKLVWREICVWARSKARIAQPRLATPDWRVFIAGIGAGVAISAFELSLIVLFLTGQVIWWLVGGIVVGGLLVLGPVTWITRTECDFVFGATRVFWMIAGATIGMTALDVLLGWYWYVILGFATIMCVINLWLLVRN